MGQLISNQVSVYLTMQQISGEIDGLNDVIETNPARQIILHELLDSPGETKFVRVINSAELLQRFEGTWRPMPDVSGVVHCNLTTLRCLIGLRSLPTTTAV